MKGEKLKSKNRNKDITLNKNIELEKEKREEKELERLAVTIRRTENKRKKIGERGHIPKNGGGL